MAYYDHYISFGCPECNACWEQNVSEQFEDDRRNDLTGTKIEGPIKCEDCGSMDVTAVVDSHEIDGSGMDEYSAAMERKSDQENGR